MLGGNPSKKTYIGGTDMKNKEKTVIEAVALQLRVLAKFLDGDEISKDDVKNLEKISNEINQLLKDEKSSDENTSIELDVKKVLEDFGISKSIKGYKYLYSAIILRLSEGNTTAKFTKDLYPKIAKEFNSTPSKVERTIRYAIQMSYEKGYLQKHESFEYFFSLHNRKPKNSEVIETVVEYLRLNHRL